MMKFRIAETFTVSLSKLTGQEQKIVKTTAFDLQMNPTNPGMQFHKINKSKDANFWAVRVSRDIRLIVHKFNENFLLCYVGHHDEAYKWAEGRKLEIHPNTGAAQIVQIREKIEKITIPKYIEEERKEVTKPLLFEDYTEEELLRYGVPQEWVRDVLQSDEDSILEVAEHLPSEAAEALLNLATGEIPKVTIPADSSVGPFDHPDAQRRFRVMNNVEELERALEAPWEKWTIFLHPKQRKIVEQNFNGPARVSGSAGTGKTIVAVHRAVHLAHKNPDARVLLATFSDTLANLLRTKLNRLVCNEPKTADQIEVYSMNGIGKRLYELNFGKPQMATRRLIEGLIYKATKIVEIKKFSKNFLITEWDQVVDAWQVKTWEEYRDVIRLGRKTRLPEGMRIKLWSIFEIVRKELRNRDLITFSEMFRKLSEKFSKTNKYPFDFIVVDEAQDISVQQLKFLAAIGNDKSNNLFFAGDLGQRIFQQPFSWKSLGVDIHGRGKTLRINYRTSHQIRKQADRLLGPEITDIDGNTEDRRYTISVFNGPKPNIMILDTYEEECLTVARWISDRINENIKAHEIGVFVRSEDELSRACNAISEAKIPFKVLDKNIEIISEHVSISTMHLAKGLEFHSVVVMACDDEIIPSQNRIEMVSDDSDLEEVYNTERHLLYVACTRARENLLVTSVEPYSEFLDDLCL